MQITSTPVTNQFDMMYADANYIRLYIFPTCLLYLVNWYLFFVVVKLSPDKSISSSSMYLKNPIKNRRNDGFDLLLLNHLSLANVDAGKSIKTTANKLPYTMNGF